ncbi:HlyD family type I secretion periplasmic adaptor subunit, partial [Nostoc sp. NIES-2111]
PKRLLERGSQGARRPAEREDDTEADIALALAGDLQDEALAAIVRSEQRVLILRRSAREVQKRQLSERAKQFEDEIAGLSRQVSAKVAENHLVQKELAGVDDLYEKKLVTLQRLSQLQREAVRIEGERGQLEAAIAEARGKIIETELKILQIDEDLRSEVARDSRETEGRIADLSERRQVAEEQLRYATLRAPQDGIIHQSIIHSAGEVVPPNTVIMLIVPDSDLLTVEAKVLPRDIDRLRVGQHARLRLTSFEARTTPELDGRVERISPDQNTDPRTGQGYFTARIAIVPGPGRNELRLLPGMTAEVFVETGLRPVLSYLAKPIEDQLHHAFRER